MNKKKRYLKKERQKIENLQCAVDHQSSPRLNFYLFIFFQKRYIPYLFKSIFVHIYMQKYNIKKYIRLNYEMIMDKTIDSFLYSCTKIKILHLNIKDN